MATPASQPTEGPVLRTGDVRATAAELAGEIDVTRLRDRVAALPAPRSSLHTPDRMRAAAVIGHLAG